MAVQAGLFDDDEDPPKFEPLIASGAEPATYSTSHEAAQRIDSIKDTQRAAVLGAIQSAGARGMTDDELQLTLGLDGSSERPRRWELWKRDRIQVLKDATGRAVRRQTRSQRSAVVWVAVA